jgi:hypothetical protein
LMISPFFDPDLSGTDFCNGTNVKPSVLVNSQCWKRLHSILRLRHLLARCVAVTP